MRFALSVTALVFLFGGSARAEPKLRRTLSSTTERAAFRGEVGLSSRSPGGRHFLELADGVVVIDGWHVSRDTNVQMIGTPVWRPDGDAVAWIERVAGGIRLAVVPALRRTPADAMTWALPLALAREAIHWSSARRVAIGPSTLAPRAVASWIEESLPFVDASKDDSR